MNEKSVKCDGCDKTVLRWWHIHGRDYCSMCHDDFYAPAAGRLDQGIERRLLALEARYEALYNLIKTVDVKTEGPLPE